MQGGPSWDSVADFYRKMYDCLNFEDASDRTVSACQDVPSGNAAVLVAHNGPTGMGEDKHAPCGADFMPDGGDWGDPDTERALEELKQQRRCISHSLRTCEPG
jgi:uncharacterized protein (TIGR04168 family)